MRTIWNGSISFGLVNIPIGMALATQRSDIAFRTCLLYTSDAADD